MKKIILIALGIISIYTDDLNLYWLGARIASVGTRDFETNNF